jgi:Cu/Ag efflux protein CusF
MTMTFVVRDKASPNGIKARDKVRFRAERSGDALVITKLKAIHRPLGRPPEARKDVL